MPIRGKWYPFRADIIGLIPQEPGAYELGFNGIVVYIGSSDNSIRSRIHSHTKRKTFMKVTHFRYKVLEWASDARELETKLCEDFKKKNKGTLPRLQQRAPKHKPSIWDL